MLSLGIVMLLAMWRSRDAGVLSASWEAMFWCAGATVVLIGGMMYLSVLIAWWDRWLLHRRVLLSFAGSAPLTYNES